MSSSEDEAAEDPLSVPNLLPGVSTSSDANTSASLTTLRPMLPDSSQMFAAFMQYPAPGNTASLTQLQGTPPPIGQSEGAPSPIVQPEGSPPPVMQPVGSPPPVVQPQPAALPLVAQLQGAAGLAAAAAAARRDICALTFRNSADDPVSAQNVFYLFFVFCLYSSEFKLHWDSYCWDFGAVANQRTKHTPFNH